MNVGSSSHLNVIESFALTNFITLAKFVIESPRVRGLSTQYFSKPSIDNYRLTRATWELSIAYNDIPWGVASMFTSVTRSFIESTIFFRTYPSANFASNTIFIYFS